MAVTAHSQILSAGDPILAIDLDGNVSNSNYPGPEAPQFLLDGLGVSVPVGTSLPGTKYLNFGGPTSGFIVTLDEGPTAVQSFQLVAGNDAPGRDPSDYILYGTNNPIVSTDNSSGLGEVWTEVSSGTINPFGGRDQAGDLVTFSNTVSYASYKMIYPNLSGDGLFQLNDAQFYSDAVGSAPLLSTAGEGGSILGIHEGSPDSSYPGAEGPANLLDALTPTKYLNFGNTNSGFIVTPQGPNAGDVVGGIQLTTANDAPERDPATWELWGTNDAIVSVDNSDGDLENWTLIDAGTFTSAEVPDARETTGSIVSVDGTTAFDSYRVVFPTLRDAAAANSMQLADIQFFAVPEPSTSLMMLFAASGMLLFRRKRS